MKDYLLGFLAVMAVYAFFCGGSLLTQAAQQQQARALVYPAQGSQPESVVIKYTMPDTAQLCAETKPGQVVCQNVGEFRRWIVNPLKK